MAIFNFNNHQDDAEHDDNVNPVHQVTNDDLLGLWRTFTLKQEDANMSAFLEELIEYANLITFAMSKTDIPLTAEGHLDFNQNVELQFPLLTGADEKTFQPFFTDWQAAQTLLTQWADNGNQETVDQSVPIAVDFTDLVRLVGGNEDVAGAVINPFEDNITMDRESLLDLHHQAQQRNEAADTPVHVGDSLKAPDGLLEAWVDKFVADGQVQRAWLRTLTMGGQQSLFLVLDMPQRDDQEEFFDQLGLFAKEFGTDPDLGLTIAPYSEDLAEAIEGAVPFYAK